MEEQNQNSVNLEIPSRWRRFSAYLLDLLINITIIGLIINLIILFVKKTTLGNILTCTKAVNTDNKPINGWQATLRLFVFNPAFLASILLLIRLLISLMIYVINGGCNGTYYDFESNIIQNQDPTCERVKSIRNIASWSRSLGLILLFINVVELFFKCPTFIDKLLGIKRFYKKSE